MTFSFFLMKFLKAMSKIELIKEALKQNPFFCYLKEEHLEKLALIGEVLDYKKGESIFFEGKEANSTYLIIDGIVKIYKIGENGKEQIIHIFGKGELFAEIALIENQTYPASAEALTFTKLVAFRREKLKELFRNDPEIMTSILGICIFRLQKLISFIESIRLRDARKRVLYFLWELSENGKINPIKLGFKKHQIALLLGITPETFSRVLKGLKEEGIITEATGKKVLLNLDKLKEELV